MAQPCRLPLNLPRDTTVQRIECYILLLWSTDADEDDIVTGCAAVSKAMNRAANNAGVMPPTTTITEALGALAHVAQRCLTNEKTRCAIVEAICSLIDTSALFAMNPNVENWVVHSVLESKVANIVTNGMSFFPNDIEFQALACHLCVKMLHVVQSVQDREEFALSLRRGIQTLHNLCITSRDNPVQAALHNQSLLHRLQVQGNDGLAMLAACASSVHFDFASLQLVLSILQNLLGNRHIRNEVSPGRIQEIEGIIVTCSNELLAIGAVDTHPTSNDPPSVQMHDPHFNVMNEEIGGADEIGLRFHDVEEDDLPDDAVSVSSETAIVDSSTIQELTKKESKLQQSRQDTLSMVGSILTNEATADEDSIRSIFKLVQENWEDEDQMSYCISCLSKLVGDEEHLACMGAIPYSLDATQRVRIRHASRDHLRKLSTFVCLELMGRTHKAQPSRSSMGISAESVSMESADLSGLASISGR